MGLIRRFWAWLTRRKPAPLPPVERSQWEDFEPHREDFERAYLEQYGIKRRPRS